MISVRRAVALALPLLGLAGLLAACGGDDGAGTRADGDRPTVVVTYAVLGSVVSDIVGDRAEVVVLMPNGTDPHEWSPSAKDVGRLLDADLVVDNGLGLEGNLVDPLAQARKDGVAVFTVAEHVTVRRVQEGEGAEPDDPDQAPGAEDPHLWMDPLTMKEWIGPFADALADAGVDVGDGAERVKGELDALDRDVRAVIEPIPTDDRVLVTGHESMGYFAARYDFRLIGAVVPSITSQAETSAGELAALRTEIEAAGVKVIYTELGTPQATVDALADDAGVRVVELSTHTLPADGTYRTFLLDIADAVAGGLR